MLPIVRGYLELIKPGMRILEVGCGAWDWIRAKCESVGAQYEGNDVLTEYYGQKTIATRFENLADLSFPNDEFDLVIGNQSMEHWAEHGCSLRWGLYQCFRVCKPRGKILLNVPIHFHGTREFMLGELDKLRKLFAPFSNTTVFEKWGSPCAPLPPHVVYPHYRRLRNSPAYVLDIQAVKDRPLPKGYRNRNVGSGRYAEFVNLPLSYNFLRLRRRLRRALRV